MKRLALVALALAAACGRVTREEPGPADRFYRPTGLGVYAGNLVVASSNADLRFDADIGGTVIAVDPGAGPRLTGTVPVRSFAGPMVIATPDECPAMRQPAATPTAAALFAVRGGDQLYAVRVGADGALSCDGCALPVSTPQVADAFAVGLACTPELARAYVGYLRSDLGQTFLTQVDLARDPADPRAVQTRALSVIGQVRAFAFDAVLGRLYFTRTVSAGATTFEWLQLDSPCQLVPAEGEAGCASGSGAAGTVPQGLELRGIALSSSPAPGRRVYLTARVYDPAAAAAAGVRIGDFDGLLLAADLRENLTGQVELRIERQLSIGFGPGDVVRLPAVEARAGKRDVVAALAADDGVVWILDDETGQVVPIGRDLVRDAGQPTGAPLVGRGPFGLAADPVPLAGDVARLYVGSFLEDFVTAIDVPLADPAAACVVRDPALPFPDRCANVAGGDAPFRIRGGTP